jgi:hypothetical protein
MSDLGQHSSRAWSPAIGCTPSASTRRDREPVGSLAALAYPNPDCTLFNRFDAGNLSVIEWTGKNDAALAVVSRFVIDLRIGPRDLTTVATRLASVTRCR